MNTYVCGACGAKIIVNSDQHFTECLYCGNTINISDEKIYDLNIRKMIPFSIDKQDAVIKIQKIIKKNIIEAKKVYVPVIFANYHYTYLLYFEYEETYTDEDGDTHKAYYDTEKLFEGDSYREAIFGSSKVRDVKLASEYSKMPTIDFDPAQLEDVSIEYSSFDDEEQLVENAEKRIINHLYNQIKFHYHITNIYTQNVFLSDFNTEKFTTLVPVYVMTTEDGELYNIPGIQLENMYKRIKKSRKNTTISLIVTILLLILMIFNNHNSEIIVAFFLALVFLIVFIILEVNIKTDALNDKHDNYSQEEYNFKPSEKRVRRR